MTTTAPGAADRIVAAVCAWPGVSEVAGSRGERSLRVGRREVGHLHGDRVAHFSFTRRLGEELQAEGRIGPHPVFPDAPGMGARRIDGPGDEADVIALMRRNYDRIVARYGLPQEPAAA
ncbi:MAG TPA: luciferase family protein [Capillimicrobium sp.]|nr:luciferase family protein [Capillimicrobium sp.]